MLNKKELNRMQQSPLREKGIEDLGENQKEAVDQLESLFTYYASKFSRHQYRQLSHKSYVEMMSKLFGGTDTMFKTRSAEQKKQDEDRIRKVEILYFSKSREGVTFEQFLDLIPGLAKIQYPQLKDTVEENSMMMKDMLNLYRRQVELDYSGKYINIDLSFTDETTKYILKLAPEFLKIYREYFPHQHNKNIKRGNIKDESFRCFLKFIKEFQVFPKLITAGGAYFIFKQTLNNPETQVLNQEIKQSLPADQHNNKMGGTFTLGKFISALVAISRVSGEKIKSNQQEEECQKDGFRSLLQYIQMTKAYKKERHLKQSGESFSFILLEQYPKELFKTPRVFRDGKDVTPKKSQFLRLLRKMDI